MKTCPTLPTRPFAHRFDVVMSSLPTQKKKKTSRFCAVARRTSWYVIILIITQLPVDYCFNKQPNYIVIWHTCYRGVVGWESETRYDLRFVSGPTCSHRSGGNLGLENWPRPHQSPRPKSSSKRRGVETRTNNNTWGWGARALQPRSTKTIISLSAGVSFLRIKKRQVEQRAREAS